MHIPPNAIAIGPMVRPAAKMSGQVHLTHNCITLQSDALRKGASERSK